MIGDLCALLTEEHLRMGVNARSAYERLCDLGEQVRRHLAEEDHNVFPGLRVCAFARAPSDHDFT